MGIFVAEKVEQYIGITKEEYEELIEARQRLNAVYGFINSEIVRELKYDGKEPDYVETEVLKIVSGFRQNQKYYDAVKREYEMGVRK